LRAACASDFCQVARDPVVTAQLILAVVLALRSASPGGPPWDKAPEKWDQADAYRILQDSPWSPAGTRVDAKSALRHTDTPTGLVTDAPVNTNNTNQIPGLELRRGRPQPDVPALWWSSKTVRLAQQRVRQLRNAAKTTGPLRADDLPDYILVMEGSEALRILRDAKEDLHDTVFLELPGGATLDLESVRFLEGTEDEEARVEFHFPRQIDGRATLDPECERVIFHCKGSAKMPRVGRDNVVALRAEFKPRAMRVRGAPDL
jgi:hypothetical protein